jgi:membrane-associated protein
MKYPRFVSFSIIGGILWVSICSLAGYFFGQMPFVKKNFELVVLAIIFVSILPMIIEIVRARMRAKASTSPTA